MTDPHAVTLADLPDGWSCMSLDGYAIGGTPEALDEVKRVLTENTDLKKARLADTLREIPEVNKAFEDVQRLTAEHEYSGTKACMERIAKLEAELDQAYGDIERLTAERDNWKKRHAEISKHCDWKSERIATLTAECAVKDKIIAAAEYLVRAQGKDIEQGWEDLQVLIDAYDPDSGTQHSHNCELMAGKYGAGVCTCGDSKRCPACGDASDEELLANWATFMCTDCGRVVDRADSEQNALDAHDCGDVLLELVGPTHYRCKCGVDIKWSSVESEQVAK